MSEGGLDDRVALATVSAVAAGSGFADLVHQLSLVREAGRYALRDNDSLRSRFAGAHKRTRLRAVVSEEPTPGQPVAPATPAVSHAAAAS